jgi:hypothetical protein
MTLRRSALIIGIAASLAMVSGIIVSFLMSGASNSARDKAPDRVLSPAAVPAPPPVSPVAALSLERFSATRERPLFSPTRRPPPAPPAPVVSPPSPPAPPKIALLGTVMDAGEARALVKLEGTDKMLRLRIGDNIGGWKVTEIETRTLVVSREDRSASFTLFSGQGAGVVQLQPLKVPARRRD